MSSSLQARAARLQIQHCNNATKPKNPRPLTEIVPDCVFLIFEYHVQPVSQEMETTLTKSEARFCANYMRSWKFDTDVDIRAFFEKLAPYNRYGPPIYINAKCNKSLSDAAFPYFQGVRELNINGWGLYSRNTITDHAFQWLRGIEKLNMSYNHASCITNRAFESLRGIKELNMSWCYQETITNEAFTNLRGIKVLKMEGISQQDITNEAMTNLRGIHTLYISSFSNISEDAFENVRGIKVLRMRNASIIEKEEFFANLRGIEVLTLGCSLNKKEDHTLTPAAFKNLRGIRELDVSAYDLDKNGEQTKMLEQLRGIQKLRMRGAITAKDAQQLRGAQTLEAVHCQKLVDMLSIARNLQGCTFLVSPSTEEHYTDMSM